MKRVLSRITFGFVLAILCLLFSSSVSGANSLSSAPNGALRKGLDLYKGKKYSQALLAFQKLEKESPQTLRSEAVFMQGRALQALERWSEAEPLFARVAEAFPDLADYALYYQGETLRKGAEKGKSLQVFQNLITSHPQSLLIPKARLQMAEILLETGDALGAAVLCEQVIQGNGLKNPGIQALYLLAQAKEKMEAWAEAAALYQNFWLKYPLHPKAKEAQGCYEALRRERKIPEIKIPPEALFQRTQALYQARLYEAALSGMEKLEGFPAEAYPARYGGELWVDELYFQRGMISFRLKKYAAAADTLNLVFQNSRPREIGERAFYWRCQALQRLGRNEEVLSILSSYAQAFPSGIHGDKILQLKAEILEERGAVGEAVSAYREIVEKFPQSYLIYSSLWKAGWLLFQTPDIEGAIRSWQSLGRLKPSSPWSEKALYWRAKGLEKMGRKEEAAEIQRRLREEFPAAYHSQLSLGEGTCARPAGGFSPVQDSSLPSFLHPTNQKGGTENPRLKKGALLARLNLFAEALEEFEAAEAKGGMGEEMRLEISRLLREAGEFHRSTLLVRRNFPIRPLPPNLSEKDRSLYLLAYPIGNPEWLNLNAKLQDLDPALVSAVILEESRFDTQALSVSGARGLMQIMPATGRDIAKKLKVRPYGDQNLFEPETNIRMGSWYLARLLEDFGGKMFLAVAAYNAGPRAVREWMAKAANAPEDEFVERIPYPETRNYVVRVLTSYQVYRTLYRSSEN